MRATLVAITDKHGGNALGLMNPDTVFYKKNKRGDLEEYTLPINDTQEWLWEVYGKIIKRAKQTAKRSDSPLFVIDLGDQTQGFKYHTELVSTSLADQILIAKANLMPWYNLKRLKAVRLIAGTASHEFEEAGSTVLVSRNLKDKYPDIDTRPMFHGLFDFGGVTIDAAHHGPNDSSREWLKGNSARYYLRDLMTREIMSGREPPKLVLRGHYHVRIYETLRIWTETKCYQSHIIVGPPLCAFGDYARQITRSAFQVTVGGVIIEVVDGKILEPEFISETIDVRTKEKLL